MLDRFAAWRAAWPDQRVHRMSTPAAHGLGLGTHRTLKGVQVDPLANPGRRAICSKRPSGNSFGHPIPATSHTRSANWGISGSS
jgi:hypothetical protein